MRRSPKFLEAILSLVERYELYSSRLPNHPNAKEIVFGKSGESDECQVIIFCILQVKYYIYRQRLFNEKILHLPEMKRILATTKLSVEKRICTKEGKICRLKNMKGYMETYTDNNADFKSCKCSHTYPQGFILYPHMCYENVYERACHSVYLYTCL